MLTVDGAMRVRAINVDPDAVVWSDYVFDKNNQLNTIIEVEEYIKNNKHLPDVPSENDIKSSGVNLAEMDAILLRKIEELTLYIIKQQKKINELEKQINSKMVTK